MADGWHEDFEDETIPPEMEVADWDDDDGYDDDWEPVWEETDGFEDDWSDTF